MSFRPPIQQVDLTRLKATLLTSGLQQKDNPLFQVINQLISAVEQNLGVINGSVSGVAGGGSSASGLLNKTYITVDDESAVLFNSKRLLAGSFIFFDTSVANQLGLSGSEWSVLTDGDIDATELIYANGEVIMTHTP